MLLLLLLLPQVGQYESFLRRMIRRAPHASFLLLENFYFYDVTVRKWNNVTNSIMRFKEANPYYQTGDRRGGQQQQQQQR
jgi:hypothetical protein